MEEDASKWQNSWLNATGLTITHPRHTALIKLCLHCDENCSHRRTPNILKRLCPICLYSSIMSANSVFDQNIRNNMELKNGLALSLHVFRRNVIRLLSFFIYLFCWVDLFAISRVTDIFVDTCLLNFLRRSSWSLL